MKSGQMTLEERVNMFYADAEAKNEAESLVSQMKDYVSGLISSSSTPHSFRVLSWLLLHPRSIIAS